MFVLKFGAFDVVLYVVAVYGALVLSGTICNELGVQHSRLASATVKTSHAHPDLSRSVRVKSNAVALKEQPRPSLKLVDVKLYKLHQKLVVKLSSLPFNVPDTIKRYRLRGEDVVRLEALEDVALVIS